MYPVVGGIEVEVELLLRALFEGLYIHDKWEWLRRHPVIRLSFGDGVLQSRERERTVVLIDEYDKPILDNLLERDQIRHWYNGYRWGGAEVTSVYNPFDVLLLFQTRQFGPYWFESATPTFLVELLRQRGVFTPALSQRLRRQVPRPGHADLPAGRGGSW